MWSSCVEIRASLAKRTLYAFGVGKDVSGRVRGVTGRTHLLLVCILTLVGRRPSLNALTETSMGALRVLMSRECEVLNEPPMGPLVERMLILSPTRL